MGFLRLALAYAVVVGHTGTIFGYWYIGGILAVEIFFVISGFYMALILNEKYTGIRSSYYLFITNRLIKIFPLYFVVLLTTLLLTYLLQRGIWIVSIDVPSFVKFFSILTNVTVFGQDLLHFIAIDSQKGDTMLATRPASTYLNSYLIVPQSWALALELYFYLMVFFLIKNKFRFLWISILLAFSVFLKLLLTFKGLLFLPWDYRFFFAELYLFLYGVVAYYFYVKLRTNAVLVKYSKVIYFILVNLIVYLFLHTQSYINLNIVSIDDVIFKESLYLLFMVLLPVLFLVSKHNKFDRTVGELSYPVYLVHLAVPLGLEYFSINVANKAYLLWTIVAASVILNYTVQNPIERYRQQRVQDVRNTET